jgi:hypothetical protein
MWDLHASQSLHLLSDDSGSVTWRIVKMDPKFAAGNIG